MIYNAMWDPTVHQSSTANLRSRGKSDVNKIFNYLIGVLDLFWVEERGVLGNLHWVAKMK